MITFQKISHSSLNFNSLTGTRFYKTLLVTAFLCTGIFCTSVNAATPVLKVYKAPKEALLNTVFTVKVRTAGTSWKDVPTYSVKVDQVKATDHSEEKASMSFFDFAGEVEVAVTLNQGVASSAAVRPSSQQILHQIKGNTLFFKLRKAVNLSIEFNGDIFHNLHLFANPIESFVPDLKDKNLIYFGPGMHEITGGILKVPSGKTVYVHGEAILKGQILIQNAKNVRVLGRGMVDQGVKMGIRIANSQNVEVNGLFATQCFTGGSDSVLIRNVKVMSYYGWGDGMNVIASNNVLIDSVFNRNSDDCTTVYGSRFTFKGGCKNITFQNSVLWADVAHPILIGTHGSTPEPEILEDITYNNIDILDHKEAQMDYQGCFAINAGDSNLIRNVKFENIRVEDFRQGQLINIRVFYNRKYCTSPGRGVENVLFKNISYKGKNAETSIITGYDKDRMVKNVVFENLRINGVLYSDDMNKPAWYKTSDLARIFTGDHVEGVVFKKTE